MPLESTQAHAVRIVIADDHELVRAGLKALLAQVPGVVVIAEACDGNELIAAVDREQPDIVLTDIGMPGLDGLSALANLHQRHPQVRLVIVSTHATAEFIRRAVANGACGYLTKDASPGELEQAVRSVMARGSYFSGQVARQLLEPAEPTADEELTPRQVEILRLLVRGMASKEIAYQLGLSSKTVDVHRGRMMERIGVHDVAGLTRYAIRKKLIEP